MGVASLRMAAWAAEERDEPEEDVEDEEPDDVAFIGAGFGASDSAAADGFAGAAESAGDAPAVSSAYRLVRGASASKNARAYFERTIGSSLIQETAN